MNIEVKSLTPKLTEDYLSFFDVTPHSEKPDSDDCKCYCVWWCADDQNSKVFNEYLSTKDKRREYARRAIASGKLKGYLAFDGGRVIGWCNANAKVKCYGCFCWRSFMGQARKETDADRVKSVFCFAVSPQARGMGVATRLLEAVCAGAREEGFEYVEAYPNSSFVNQAEDFMGPASMYEKAGFTEVYLMGEKTVMRKKLR